MKVLLGVGGTEDGFLALARTLERVERTGDDLTIAVLENPDSDLDPAEVERRVREELEGAGASVTVRRVEGHPGSRLVEIAETEGYDAIVLGGGKQSPMGKISLGQVAEFVILNATVSVRLVR